MFINKQGRKISWFFSEKLKQHPPTKPDEDWGPDDDEVADEEDPESQESHGWLESGNPLPPQDPPKTNEASPSDYQGKKKDIESFARLEDVITTNLEDALSKNRDIHQYKDMCEPNEVMKCLKLQLYFPETD